MLALSKPIPKSKTKRQQKMNVFLNHSTLKVLKTYQNGEFDGVGK